MKERAFLPLLKTSVAQLTIIWNSAGKEELNLNCQSALRVSDGNWNQGPDTQKRGQKQTPKCRFARVFPMVWYCEPCSLSYDYKIMDPKQGIGVENGRIKKKQDEDSLNKAGIFASQ